MTTLTLLLAFALSLLALPVAVAAQTIDITDSQFEVRSPDTLRLRNVTVTGYPGKYFADIQWNGAGAFVPIAAGEETSPPFYDKTLLIKGKWHFVYTIISTFTDDYTLNNIPGSTNSQGGYFIHGTDKFGGPVVAAYWPNNANWTLLDPGAILIDLYYTFTTDGNVILPGSCYRQINKATLAFSNCYALSGSKTGPADAAAGVADSGDEVAGLIDRAHEAHTGAMADAASPPDMAVREKYWIMKGLMGTQP